MRHTRFAPGGVLAAGLLLLCLTACTGAPSTTPQPTLLGTLVTLPPAETRFQALPPTWTPAPTRTPAPTFTPFPTATPIPTASVGEVCAAFKLLLVPSAEIDFDGVGRFVWQGVPRGAGVIISVTLENTTQGISLNLPVEGSGTFEFSLMRLPQAGRYEWRITMQHPFYGEICTQTGIFTRKEPIML